MAGREVSDDKGGQHGGGSQRQPTRRTSGLVLLPRREKPWLIDVPVNPVAVFEVIVEERVDNMERGQDRNQIAIVVAVRVEDVVARCFLRGCSRPWTLLGGTFTRIRVSSAAIGENLLNFKLTINS